ncbi:hypothetical protein IF188_11570 [Microbacterium sp. NEAU-LLC]|uniref:Uncharacterized protein n=1 Tax=Microbacterium helvum TaxID=2773713 RepID=A0ABR8NRG0_9MICO|nr:hypothetical protein [Microbacterium helvum]MBD3942337.1 hypothetical protein [Microbacterium helvum]
MTETADGTKRRRDTFAPAVFVFMAVVTALTAWLVTRNWLDLFAQWDQEVYLPGRGGGGFVPAPVAVAVTTPILLFFMWMTLLTLRPALPKVKHLVSFGATLSTFVVCALIVIGALMLAPPDTSAMVCAIVGTAGILSLVAFFAIRSATRDPGEH